MIKHILNSWPIDGVLLCFRISGDLMVSWLNQSLSLTLAWGLRQLTWFKGKVVLGWCFQAVMYTTDHVTQRGDPGEASHAPGFALLVGWLDWSDLGQWGSSTASASKVHCSPCVDPLLVMKWVVGQGWLNRAGLGVTVLEQSLLHVMLEVTLHACFCSAPLVTGQMTWHKALTCCENREKLTCKRWEVKTFKKGQH